MEKRNPVRNQTVHVQRLSKKGAHDAVDSTQFKQLVRTLRYLTSTRPKFMYPVNLVSQKNQMRIK